MLYDWIWIDTGSYIVSNSFSMLFLLESWGCVSHQQNNWFVVSSIILQCSEHIINALESQIWTLTTVHPRMQPWSILITFSWVPFVSFNAWIFRSTCCHITISVNKTPFYFYLILFSALVCIKVVGRRACVFPLRLGIHAKKTNMAKLSTIWRHLSLQTLKHD